MILSLILLTARLQYGCTWINTHFMLANEMPHGGLKSSGYGKDLSMRSNRSALLGNLSVYGARGRGFLGLDMTGSRLRARG